MRIHHVALRVADLDRSGLFYAQVLGLTEIRRQADAGRPRSIWLAAGASVLMLELRLAGEGCAAGSGHLLAFAADDLATWGARLQSAGVMIDSRSRDTLYFRDPDGHRVAVSVYPLGAED